MGFCSSSVAMFSGTLHEGAIPTARLSLALLHRVPCNTSTAQLQAWTRVGCGGDEGGLGLESCFSTRGCGGDSDAWIGPEKPISCSSTSVASLRTTSCEDGDHLRMERKHTDATGSREGEVNAVERIVARNDNVSEGKRGSRRWNGSPDGCDVGHLHAVLEENRNTSRTSRHAGVAIPSSEPTIVSWSKNAVLCFETKEKTSALVRLAAVSIEVFADRT